MAKGASEQLFAHGSSKLSMERHGSDTDSYWNGYQHQGLQGVDKVKMDVRGLVALQGAKHLHANISFKGKLLILSERKKVGTFLSA